MKSAYITPILKKADLDSSDPKSYRPISNLQCFVLVSICLSVHYFDPFGRWSSCMGGICSTREINNCELFECRLVNNYDIVSW